MKQRTLSVTILLGACLLAAASCSDKDESTYVDPCSTDPCTGHGDCDEGVCTCFEGYANISCDSCATGYTGYPDCERIDPACVGKSCNFGTCNAGACECNPGYAGEICTTCATGYKGYPVCVPE